MPANLTFVMDMTAFEELMKEMPDKIAQGGRDALNRTAGHVRTVAATDIAGEMGAKKASVMKRIHLAKATLAKLYFQVIVRGGTGINVASFRSRQTRSGITARISGANVNFPRAFLAKNLAGARTGFTDKVGASKRAMVKGRYAGRKIMRGPRAGQPLLRQPLEGIKGPSPAETWQNTPGIQKHARADLEETLSKNLLSQFKRFSAGPRTTDAPF